MMEHVFKVTPPLFLYESPPSLHLQLGDSSKQPDFRESYGVNYVKVEEAATKQQVSADHMWIADTGSERHMRCLADWFAKLKQFERPVTVKAANKGLTTVEAYGSVIQRVQPIGLLRHPRDSPRSRPSVVVCHASIIKSNHGSWVRWHHREDEPVVGDLITGRKVVERDKEGGCQVATKTTCRSCPSASLSTMSIRCLRLYTRIFSHISTHLVMGRSTCSPWLTITTGSYRLVNG